MNDLLRRWRVEDEYFDDWYITWRVARRPGGWLARFGRWLRRVLVLARG